MDPISVCAVTGWLTLHFGALALAWGTRVATGTRLETITQVGFFATMAGVGAAIWIGREVDIEFWPASAVTLIAMVLTAVIDFRRLGETAHVTAAATSR